MHVSKMLWGGCNKKKTCLNEGITLVTQYKRMEKWEKGGAGQIERLMAKTKIHLTLITITKD